MKLKTIAAVLLLAANGYFVWLLAPSLLGRDGNLLVTLFLLANAVSLVLSARYLLSRWRSRNA